METFRYDRGASRTQELIPSVARAATFALLLEMRVPAPCLIRLTFDDVPDVANRVTPRFFPADDPTLPLIDGDPVEGPNVIQNYLLGHGQVVPSGVVAKITGQTEGPGMGVIVDYDLDVTAVDQLKARGITGHSALVLERTVIELTHDGVVPVTYGATISLVGT